MGLIVRREGRWVDVRSGLWMAGMVIPVLLWAGYGLVEWHDLLGQRHKTGVLGYSLQIKKAVA